MNNRIITTYGQNLWKMTIDVLRKAELEKMIPKGSYIGIKPNLVVAKPSSSGATTSPIIVSALIEYLKEYQHDNLVILESSWIGDSTNRAFKVCGYQDISKKYNVPLFDIKQDTYTMKTFNGMKMEVSDKVLSLDFIINVPVLKGHCQTLVTGALKNMKGCISDREKRNFHTRGLHRPIAYLNKIIKQDFVLVDGICGDLDFEEGGNPVQMNRIFCGTDPVLMDSYIASNMGYRPYDVNYIKIAEEIGVGSADIENADIIVLDKDESIAKPSPSRKVQRLSQYVNEKDACSACYANLIQALARLDDEGLLHQFKNNPIFIGQGYKAQECDGLGIGKCTSGVDKNIGGCPPSTPAILDFLKSI
ncbi:MAG TPA: DUF362 domain-containing protein [Clostridiaceae bacterium]|jgi:uncharacterized protein (DUF362 family)|nr:DUF362 domain-containing protein [Clostridiaceae bacterium]